MRLQDIVEAVNPNITFEYIEDSEGDKNRGWQVDMVKARLDGKEVGYLKIAYIPTERLKKWYPTIFSYLDQIKGNHTLPFKYRTSKIEDIPASALRNNIFYAAQAIDRTLSYDDLNYLNKLSDEQIHNEYKRLEKLAEKRFKRNWNEFVNWHVDKPVVDYIRVEPDYQKQGIGTALYRAGHKWMKKKGMKLYASTLQSKQAEEVWKRLEQRYPVEKEKSLTKDIKGKFKMRRFFADEEI